MKLQPVLDHIIVTRSVSEKVSPFGIVIPDSFDEKPDQGIVVAVGPGGRKSSGEVIPMTVQAGDKILFGKNAGFEIAFEGETYLVLKEVNIFAIIK